MDLSFPPFRIRAFHGHVQRLVTGAVAAALLVVLMPVPATAAPPTPSITITDVTVTEGTGGTVNASFTIATASPKAGTLQVSWATAPGSAASPADFTAASGTVSLTKTAPATVSVLVIGDALNEANETFVVNLTNPRNATIGDAQGVATITDNDPVPVLSVNDVSVTEGNSGTTTATFTMTLSAASGRAVTFQWTTVAGSATVVTDYAAASGSRTMAAGATTSTVGIIVKGDLADELDETFGITLSSPGNATIGDGSGLATISDDDPVPDLSVNDRSVTEGNAGTTMATFTVTLSTASGKAVSFDWVTAPGTATVGTDYVAASGSKTIAAGTPTATIDITVNGDVVDEANETFGITLSNPGNAGIGDGSGAGTITDDDAAPTLSVNDVTVTEGNAGTSTATFAVTLSAASAKTVTVDWTTANASAIQPSDYVAGSGTLTFVPGDTSQSIDITVNGDVLDEANETFGITLSNPGNATIADGAGLGTISDDDATPTLSVNDVTVTEGNTGNATATFTVTLSAASGQAVTFDWASAAGSATAGVDYVAASGIKTIAAGSTTTTFTVTVKSDAVDEADETYGITLSNPGNATIADGSGLGTIADDDAAPILLVNDVSITEGNAGTSPATFTVALSAPSGKTVTVDWANADDSATQPSDYAAGTGTLTFAPGDTSESIVVTVNSDVADEVDETFGVALSNPGNATISDGSGVGTITDDDAAPTLSVNNVSLVAEGHFGTTTATFTVTLSAASGRTVTVSWATADDMAIQPADYTDSSGLLTFVPGDTSETFGVTVNGDIIAELDETFRVVLTNPSNATLGDAQGLGTITDDELLPVIDIDIDELSIVEGQSGKSSISFSVILSHPSAIAPVTVDWTTTPGTAAAGSDYVAASGTVTFAPMDISETVSIFVKGDGTFEGDETFALDLSNSSGVVPIGNAQGMATIVNDDKAPTSLTLRVVRKPRAVVARGILEPATSGEHVTVTLFRKQGGKFVKVASKTVSVRYLDDRDDDGKIDGSYTATFTRPKTKGSYKVLTRFNGTASYKPRSLAKIFTLAAS